MGLTDFFEIGTWIKFFVLSIPLVLFVFAFAPTFKWKLLLSLAGVIGIVFALSGTSLRKRE